MPSLTKRPPLIIRPPAAPAADGLGRQASKTSSVASDSSRQGSKTASMSTEELLEQVLDIVTVWQQEVDTEVIHLEDRCDFVAAQLSGASDRLIMRHSACVAQDASGDYATSAQVQALCKQLEDREQQCSMLRNQCLDLSQAMVQKRRVHAYYLDQARAAYMEDWLAARTVQQQELLPEKRTLRSTASSKLLEQPRLQSQPQPQPSESPSGVATVAAPPGRGPTGPPPRRAVRQRRQPQSPVQSSQHAKLNGCGKAGSGKVATTPHVSSQGSKSSTKSLNASTAKRPGSFPLESALHDLPASAARQEHADGTQSCTVQ
mmetsp:Transcript_6695/g.14676  ORF Transcript_6695/g.14676 Transcript_6695/m.14676 type:complete len:318 (+) Transcript_6695:75-1028(+)